MADVREIWIQASAVAIDVAAQPQVSTRWDEPSSLPGMTIGGLCSHLLNSGIIILEESLDSAVPNGTPFTSALVFSMIDLDPEHETSSGVRDVAAGQAASGHAHLLEQAAASRERSIPRLRSEGPDRVIGLAWAAHPIPWHLDEFVAARILEIVVHVDDLTVSTGVDRATLPTEAIAIACHLGVDTCIRRHGAAAVMRGMFRRDRNPTDALRPF